MNIRTIAEESSVSIPDTIVMLTSAQVDRVFGLEGRVQPLCTTRNGIPKNILLATTLAHE